MKHLLNTIKTIGYNLTIRKTDHEVSICKPSISLTISFSMTSCFLLKHFYLQQIKQLIIEGVNTYLLSTDCYDSGLILNAATKSVYRDFNEVNILDIQLDI